MKSNEELQSLFDNDLRDKLTSLEAIRIKVRNRVFLLGIIVLVTIISFAMSGEQGFEFMLFLGIIGVVGAAVMIFLWRKDQGLYRREFKEKVVRAIVALINPDWNYDPDGYIYPDEYYRSKLFTRRHDRYKGDDLVTGAIDKTDFKISELHSEYKTQTTDSKGNTKTTWHTIFKGLFVHLDFNKEIKGETLVLPDTAEKLFGSLGKTFQKWGSGSRELVKLENVEFEKLFVVYGTDQNEARYILTPTMMEAMTRIVEVYGRKVYFSFIGSRVYFAVMISKDLFEPRVFSSGVRFEDVERMNRNFGIIETLIHEMNLNTRIWTKN